MEKRRCVKMDDITKNMLLYALRDVFREEKSNGCSTEETRALVVRVAELKSEKLFLTEAEYQKVIEALNKLRDTYLAAGRYADGIDTVFYKILKAKYKRCAVR